MTILSHERDPYRDITLWADNDVTRYYVYANWGDEDTEEIQVDAATLGHAREIAQAAFSRDFEGGWRIVHIETAEERFDALVELVEAGMLP